MTSERFTSLRWPLAVDAGLGRLASEDSYPAHVEQLMRQVLLTAPGERVGRPDFGCGLRRLVFAANSEALANLVQVNVQQALERWLAPVVRAEEIGVAAEQERLVVTIRYLLIARQERRTLSLEVGL